MDDFALALDTETTALMKNRTMRLDKQPEIFEFYAALFNLATGEIAKEYHYLMKPVNGIPEEVSKITGVIDADVEKCLPFSAFAPHIKAALETAPMIIAHNASYDIEVLEVEFERLGQIVAWPCTPICTVEATIHCKGYRLSLSNLHEELFGEGFSGAHRAKQDVAALIKCCVELRKRGEI